MHRFGAVISASLVGRADEVEALDRAIRAARNGRGTTVVVSGEAGAGKSRLVAEARGRAERQGFVAFRGACFDGDETFPYAPWIDGLRSFLAGRDAAQIKQLLGERTGEFAKLLPELRWTFPQLPAGRPLEPEAEKRDLHAAVVQFLEHLAQVQPLLLVLEDLNWSDESSLELLQSCARRVETQPVLILVTYRAGNVPPRLAQLLADLGHRLPGEEISLALLSREETAALVQALTDTSQPIRADLLDMILSLTDGNPFFVEEVVKSLTEAGDVRQAGGGLEWNPAAGLQVPRSVREAVLRRVGRVGQSAQQLLRWAAIVGRQVEYELLAELTGSPEPELVEQVRELTGAQLLVEASADELAFHHALAREAVYASLLAHERRGLHRQVLAALERRHAAAVDAHIATLANQAFAAEDWPKAMVYSQRAGDMARAVSATQESLTQYSRAVEAARRMAASPPPALLAARGQVYEQVGEFDRSRADYEEALDQARLHGDARSEWQALLDLGFLWASRDYEQSGRYLQDALNQAYTLEDPAAVARSLVRVGNWHFNQMRLAEALADYGKGLAIFRELGDRLGIAETLDLIGMAMFNQGDIVAAWSHMNEAIDLFRRLGDKRRLAQVLVALPLGYRYNTEILGPFDPAQLLAAGDAGLQIAREIGWPAGELQAYGRQAQYGIEAGDYGQALEAAKSGAAIGEDIGHLGFLAATRWGMGQVYLELFALDRAKPPIEEAVRLTHASVSGIFRHHAQVALAQLSLARGDWKAAQEALGPHPTTPAGWLPTQERENWAMWTETLLARRDGAGALAIVDRLLKNTVNAAQFGPRAVPLLSLLRGRALLAVGRAAEAEEELAAASDVARAQGKRPLLWRIAVSQARAAHAQGRRTEATEAYAAAGRVIAEIAGTIPDDDLRRSFVKGAQSYLPKPRPASSNAAAKAQYGGLSARERQVAALITEGKSNRMIAEELVIAERTVDRHVSNIMAKLSCNSRAQIAAWAVERGLRP